IRDRGALESAISRPFHTFDGKDLYPNPVDKAAAIFESIISNHPFVDGNKRTAYVLMRLILKENHLDINVGQNEKFEFVIKAAQGQLMFDNIRDWIDKNIK
ncbi:MAG: type II toxin-antitoxin system death-on-curing family toxin, partial [Cytophagales bacterium]